ncbi:hypothetical protein R6Q59_015948 [Mikania micrantha]
MRDRWRDRRASARRGGSARRFRGDGSSIWPSCHLTGRSQRETVTPLYTKGITEIDDATFRAWWPHIADDLFAGTKARVSRIRDPLIRYMHLLIATSIAGRGRSREWCMSQDLFYLYCLITGRTCQLTRCLAEYFATYYHRQQRGAIYGGLRFSLVWGVIWVPPHTCDGRRQGRGSWTGREHDQIFQDLSTPSREHDRILTRQSDMLRWMIDREIERFRQAGAGIEPPPLRPSPRRHDP